MTAATHNIEFTLVQNALDSIERAVELLAWQEVTNEGSRLKQAILLTAHATELLLKERLRRIHPSLVWENVDKYPNLDAGPNKGTWLIKSRSPRGADPSDTSGRQVAGRPKLVSTMR